MLIWNARFVRVSEVEQPKGGREIGSMRTDASTWKSKGTPMRECRKRGTRKESEMCTCASAQTCLAI